MSLIPVPTFSVQALQDFALALLTRAGMPEPMAHDVAQVLIEGDLLGHSTHGLALLGPYLGEVESGAMCVQGEPAVINDQAAALTWDGRRLPGPWLVLRAMEAATERARRLGTGTVVIRRSHHIACLAAFHERAARDGLVMLLLSSDANSASVAPFGGLDPVFTPNPLSVGFPTPGDPVIVDVSASTTTNGLTNRLHKTGGKLPAPWLIDGHGQPSNDPAVLFNEPKGTILPLGGIDSGHKGYGLALTVEALTGGLAGFGRADPKQGWGATVFLQILDPQSFGGLDAFTRQTGKVAELCHQSRPARAGDTVRLPGERGLKLKREQASQGVRLHESIMPLLAPWAQKLGVALPPSV